MPEVTWMWCFEHATLHQSPWCDGACVPLAGATRAAAMKDKARRFGAAMLLCELAPDQQAAVIQQCEARRWPTAPRWVTG